MNTTIQKTTNKMVKWKIVYTDTFGGDANYSWANRAEFELPERASDLVAVRKSKALLGLANVRCKRGNMGDTITLRPYGRCTIAFITPIY